MKERARLCAVALVALASALAPAVARAQEPAPIGQARALLAAGNAKQAYEELSAVQDQLSGPARIRLPARRSGARQRRASTRRSSPSSACSRSMPEPRRRPDGPGARLLRRRLLRPRRGGLPASCRTRNPPPAAQQAIDRYLDAIAARKRQTHAAGWIGFGELALGYDSNITGVPRELRRGGASSRSTSSASSATGNAIKRSAGYVAGRRRRRTTSSRSRAAGACSPAARRAAAATTTRSDFNSYRATCTAARRSTRARTSGASTADYHAVQPEGRRRPATRSPPTTGASARAASTGATRSTPKTPGGPRRAVNDVRFPDEHGRGLRPGLPVGLVAAEPSSAKGVPLLYLTGVRHRRPREATALPARPA